MRLCVIPARGGSKRIPRKNIKEFCGKPMIAWSIRAAISSECFDRIIVSTDDEEIADISRTYGADVPFIRSAGLSDDQTVLQSVIVDAIERHNHDGKSATEVCCIYATAPMIQAADIKKGLDVLMASRADYAISVTSYAFPIQRAIWITDQQRVQMFQPEHLNSRSQDLKEAWHDAGQFVWGNASAWLSGKTAMGTAAAPVVLPRYRVQDIDSWEDWQHAEALFRLTNCKVL